MFTFFFSIKNFIQVSSSTDQRKIIEKKTERGFCCQEIRKTLLTPQPQWANCEIPGNTGVRIIKVGVDRIFSCVPVLAFRRATGSRRPGRGGRQSWGVFPANTHKLCKVSVVIEQSKHSLLGLPGLFFLQTSTMTSIFIIVNGYLGCSVLRTNTYPQQTIFLILTLVPYNIKPARLLLGDKGFLRYTMVRETGFLN